MKLGLVLTFLVLGACSHTPKQADLPAGCRGAEGMTMHECAEYLEYVRNEQVKQMQAMQEYLPRVAQEQQSSSALVEHVCRSVPITDFNGKYLRTDVRCW